jgi:hypothetical protein
MAGAPKKEKPKVLRIPVSPRLHSYLGVLGRQTMLGLNENEVAKAILTDALNGMLESNYHETHRPPE